MKKLKSCVGEVKIIYKTKNIIKSKVTCSSDGVENLRKIFDADTIEYREEFIALYLNRSNHTVGWASISQGGVAGTVVDVKMIFQHALLMNASGIIVAHNHPSGKRHPSSQDLTLTKKVKEAGRVMDISLLDHVILTKDSHYSFADEGTL